VQTSQMAVGRVKPTIIAHCNVIMSETVQNRHKLLLLTDRYQNF